MKGWRLPMLTKLQHRWYSTVLCAVNLLRYRPVFLHADQLRVLPQRLSVRRSRTTATSVYNTALYGTYDAVHTVQQCGTVLCYGTICTVPYRTLVPSSACFFTAHNVIIHSTLYHCTIAPVVQYGTVVRYSNDGTTHPAFAHSLFTYCTGYTAPLVRHVLYRALRYPGYSTNGLVLYNGLVGKYTVRQSSTLQCTAH